MPPRFQTTLRYTNQVVMNNPGLTWTNVRYQWTAAYDVSPVLGSTAMPGFTELAAVYRYYRCLSSAIRVDFANLDLVSGSVVVVPVNADPGVNATVFQQFPSSRSAHHRTIGALTGNGSATVTHRTSLANFGGVNIPAYDPYSSPVAAIPGNNVYWLVGAELNSAMTNGVVATSYIDITLQFFELQTPTV